MAKTKELCPQFSEEADEELMAWARAGMRKLLARERNSKKKRQKRPQAQVKHK